MKKQILSLSIAVAFTATSTFAQGPDRPPKEGPPPGEGPRPPGPMPIPFLHALDTDDDGIISADEINGAPDSLKKLDRNDDGQLTPDEWRPKPPGPPPRDGDREKGGQRDGERQKGQRDGERKRSGNRDSETKPPQKKGAEWPFGKEKTPPGNDPNSGPEKSPDQQNEKEHRKGPPPPPLLEALDTDRDGIISADEMGKSPESLATLDKNNDGQLGPREYGPRPPQDRPPGDRPPHEEPPKDGEKPNKDVEK